MTKILRRSDYTIQKLHVSFGLLMDLQRVKKLHHRLTALWALCVRVVCVTLLVVGRLWRLLPP